MSVFHVQLEIIAVVGSRKLSVLLVRIRYCSLWVVQIVHTTNRFQNIIYRTKLLNQFVKRVLLVTGVQKEVQSHFPVKRVLSLIFEISRVVQCVNGVLLGFIVLMAVSTNQLVNANLAIIGRVDWFFCVIKSSFSIWKGTNPLKSPKRSIDSKRFKCPKGHFCPAGAGQPTECPVGTFNSRTGSYTFADCKKCDKDLYCYNEGQVRPVYSIVSAFRHWTDRYSSSGPTWPN